MTSLPTYDRKYKISALLISLFTLLCATTLAQADVYKWTDTNGNTHYSDIKPNEANSEKLNIKTRKNNHERISPQNSAQQLEQNKAQELQNKAEKLQAETKKRELSSQCQNIKDNLKTLQENSRIKINENGTIRYMSPEEIENKKQTYTQQLNDLCSN